MKVTFEKAREFMYRNARLLDLSVLPLLCHGVEFQKL